MSCRQSVSSGLPWADARVLCGLISSVILYYSVVIKTCFRAVRSTLSRARFDARFGAAKIVIIFHIPSSNLKKLCHHLVKRYLLNVAWPDSASLSMLPLADDGCCWRRAIPLMRGDLLQRGRVSDCHAPSLKMLQKSGVFTDFRPINEVRNAFHIVLLPEKFVNL